MFVLLGARHFEPLRTSVAARAFLDGRASAAIIGSAITLARALTEPWQYAVLAARGVALTLLASAAARIVLVSTGLALPH